MMQITPDIKAAISSLQDMNVHAARRNTIHLFTGKLSLTTYYSAFGEEAIDISDISVSLPGLPADHVVIGITSPRGHHGHDFKISDNGTSVEGVLGRDTAVFHIYSLAGLFASGKSILRVPDLGVAFGLVEREVTRACRTIIEAPKALSAKCIVGRILIPVLDDDRPEATYYVNSLGRTYALNAISSSEFGKPAGLYDIQPGVKNGRRIGDVDEFVYTGPDSLKNDILLFATKSEARRYVDPETYYRSLDEVAKAALKDKEVELSNVKTDNAKTDNDLKTETLKAKTSYETGSLGRKESQEESSFTRNALLGGAALLTASFGLIGKLGLSPRLVGLLYGASQTMPLVSLSALFGKAIVACGVGYVICKAIKGALEGCVEVAKFAGGIVMGTLRTGCRLVGGLVRGALSLFGI